MNNFLIVTNSYNLFNEELNKISNNITNIINFNYDKYIKDIDSFSVKVGLNENGNSSEIIVNRIKEVLKNDKKI